VINKKVENHRGISLLNMYCNVYSKVFNENSKVPAELFLLERQNGFCKCRLWLNHHLVWNYL